MADNQKYTAEEKARHAARVKEREARKKERQKQKHLHKRNIDQLLNKRNKISNKISGKKIPGRKDAELGTGEGRGQRNHGTEGRRHGEAQANMPAKGHLQEQDGSQRMWPMALAMARVVRAAR